MFKKTYIITIFLSCLSIFISKVNAARVPNKTKSPLRHTQQRQQPDSALMIRRGDSVRITVRGKWVNVESTGISQQSGKLGEWIAVLPHNGKKIIHAQVINFQQVMIVL
jgi:flagella basal body P-ring formation protein FlgA